MFEGKNIRKDFPILEEKIYNKPLIYLDNGATTHRPQQVVDIMTEYYLRYNSNVHRGVHYLSNKCTDANEEARRIVRNFVNAASECEIIFTRGTTESINLVAYTFGEAFIHEGDEIIVTEMEHHANIVPWQMLCERKKAVLKIIPFDEKGTLRLDEFDSLLSSKTKLVSIAYVSNVLGSINPVRKIIAHAHAIGAKVLIDAAQAIQHIPIDVQELDCDFLAFSGHKIYGPTGIGVLYGKTDLLNQMPPWQGGGEMIKRVTFAKTTYNELPFKFEAGTPDFIGIIGLGEAIRYVQNIGLKNIAEYEHSLLQYAMDEMHKLPGMHIFGESSEKSSVISFAIANEHHSDVGTLLDKLGVAVRTGQLCAEPTMQHFNVTGMVRASLAAYNTPQEIEAFCAAIRRISNMLGI